MPDFLSFSENRSLVSGAERQSTNRGLSVKEALKVFVAAALLTWFFPSETFAFFCVCIDALQSSKYSPGFFPTGIQMVDVFCEELVKSTGRKKLCIVCGVGAEGTNQVCVHLLLISHCALLHFFD